MVLSPSEQAERQHEVCRHLCGNMSHEEDLSELVRQGSAVTGCSVLCTWPPTAGGAGYSAFAARVCTDGGRDALVVTFRGTHGAGEWGRYPPAVFQRASDVEGLRVFPTWAQTLEPIWNRRGTRVDGTGATPTDSMDDTMKAMIVRALRDDLQVWLTGHSTGGAIASVAAALLLCGRESRYPNNLSELSVMTFNAPRVLSEDHDAMRYETAREWYGVQHRRIEHRADLVREAPFGYKHVGDQELLGKAVKEGPVIQVVDSVGKVAGIVCLVCVFVAVVWPYAGRRELPVLPDL